MPRRRREGTRRGHRGASLVEFALILPLLSMFLFGIVQFGLAYDAKQSINSAAREGARYAALATSSVESTSVGPVTTPGIRQRAIDAYIGAGSGTPTVEVFHPSSSTTPMAAGKPCATPTGDGKVAVEVKIDHVVDIPFWGRETYEIKARAEFLCE